MAYYPNAVLRKSGESGTIPLFVSFGHGCRDPDFSIGGLILRQGCLGFLLALGSMLPAMSQIKSTDGNSHHVHLCKSKRFQSRF